MESSIRPFRLSLLFAATAMFGAFGCALDPPTYYYRPEATNFDERYRIFFSRKVPFDAAAGDSADSLAEKFVPREAVKASIEDLDRQGFKLAELDRIPWGEGATLFVFKRPVDPDQSILRSPLHFSGTFRLDDEYVDPTYYIFNQTTDGYKIQVVGPKESYWYDAKWEGRELVWDSAEGRNYGRLTPDGMTFYRIIESATGFNIPHDTTIMTAQRVVPIQKPDSNDAREARRYVIRLAPKTPRYYDPFPW